MFSARRRKKLAKAIDRQAKKLQAKGISVDLEALRAEYISQHKANGTFSDSDLEDDCMHIDVVGGTESDDDADDALSAFQSPRSSSDMANNNYAASDGSNGVGSPTPQLMNHFTGSSGRITGGVNIVGDSGNIHLHNGQQHDDSSAALLETRSVLSGDAQEINAQRFLFQTHLTNVTTTTASPSSLSSSSSSSSSISSASSTTLTTTTPAAATMTMAAAALSAAVGGGGCSGLSGGTISRLKLPKPPLDTHPNLQQQQQQTLTSPISIRRNNPFSIESLLFNHT